MRRTTVVMAAVLNGARSLAPPPKITLDAAMACAAPLPAGAPRLVMGSKSASRRALLQAMGCGAFDTRVADIDEYAIGDRRGDPAALVTAVAAAKCDALLERHFAAETDDDVVLVTGAAAARTLGDASSRTGVAATPRRGADLNGSRRRRGRDADRRRRVREHGVAGGPGRRRATRRVREAAAPPQATRS